ncbi:MAG TPA: NAD-dependent epimerase/dehydratase family protein [Pseudonocardiaceae bacterium]|nr:NAD-dependent epimerase/dehydratase family protein [Pseudonocardiaceae bacterium]
MHVLITGHRGFVGRHVWRACEARGDSLVGVDLVDGLDCREYFRHAAPDRFDLVVHCAATVGGRGMIEGAQLRVATNLSLDSEMFAWAARTRQRRVVYLSSSAVYPVKLQVSHSIGWRLTESDLDLQRATEHGLGGMPDATYGWAKLSGEVLAQYARDAGVRVLVVRPFSGYGEDQHTDYPFPAFIQRAGRRDPQFTVWGDGQQTRDFIHVDDVVAGMLEMVAQDVDGPVNLCTGRPTSMDDLARLACATAGYEPALWHIRDAPSGVAYRVGNPAVMSGWYEPKVTLEEGVTRALRRLGLDV